MAVSAMGLLGAGRKTFSVGRYLVLTHLKAWQSKRPTVLGSKSAEALP
jgi:hypothetical protein